jgi:hypothetical protein
MWDTARQYNEDDYKLTFRGNFCNVVSAAISVESSLPYWPLVGGCRMVSLAAHIFVVETGWSSCNVWSAVMCGLFNMYDKGIHTITRTRRVKQTKIETQTQSEK